mmetsp:Transcript_10448/g.38858  ORF Transcript_10448/g.38858 Transcript_10448/m.38858 type:complete len:307 (+) Transcript_10448:5959-6879(+)
MHPDNDDVTFLKVRLKYIGDDEERIRHAIRNNIASGGETGDVVRMISRHESEIVFLNEEFLQMISEYKNEIRNQMEDYVTVLKDAYNIKLKAYGFRLISFHIVECVTKLPSVVTSLHSLTITKCLRFVDPMTESAVSTRESRIPSYICLNAVELFVDALTEHPVYKVRELSQQARHSLDMDYGRELYKTSKEVFTKPIVVGVVNMPAVPRQATPNDIICIHHCCCDDVPKDYMCLYDYMQTLYSKVEEGQYTLRDASGVESKCKLEHLASMYRRLRSTDERAIPRRRTRAHSLSMRVHPRTHSHLR